MKTDSIRKKIRRYLAQFMCFVLLLGDFFMAGPVMKVSAGGNTIWFLKYYYGREGLKLESASMDGVTNLNSRLDRWGVESTSPYIVHRGDLYIAKRVEVENNTTLILCDEARLICGQGIHVNSGCTLKICAVSTGENWGSLIVSGNGGAGIGGDPGQDDDWRVEIHGGNISIRSNGGAGIGGADGAAGQPGGNAGKITIFSGNVSINDVSASGIGGGNGGEGAAGGNSGSISIHGGKLTIKGAMAAGIGGGNGGSGSTPGAGGSSGNVFITGGKVSIENSGAAGIGGGNGGDGDQDGGAGGAGGYVFIKGGDVRAVSVSDSGEVINEAGSNGAIGIGGGHGGAGGNPGFSGNGSAITVSAGSVSASSIGSESNGGSILLGWENAWDSFYADRYLGNPDFKLKTDKDFCYGSGADYTDVRYNPERKVTLREPGGEYDLEGKALYPEDSRAINVLYEDASRNGSASVNARAFIGETVRMKMNPKAGHSVCKFYVSDADGARLAVSGFGEDFSFCMPDSDVSTSGLKFVPIVIVKQPEDLVLTEGYEEGYEITVLVKAANSGDCYCTWWKNTTGENSGGDMLNDTSVSSCRIPTGKPGGTTEYYYCEVNQLESGVVISRVAKVTVQSVYTVSYNMLGHGEQVSACKVISGNTVESPPSDPSEEGYLFGGWYTDEEYNTLYDFGTPVNADITLYAKWTKYHSVSFNMLGHGTQIDSRQVLSGNKIQKPADPSEEGYLFGGWFTDEECTVPYDFTKTVSCGITLYAKWTKYHSVSFNMLGHGTQVPACRILSGNTVERPADPSAEGYYFSGWYTDTGCTVPYDFSSAVSGDLTIYAGWVKIHTVRFNMMGCGTQIPDRQVLNGDTTGRPADPAETGYLFEGWYTDPECTSYYNFGSAVTGDLTLYAKWIKYHNVNYNMLGHGIQIPARQVPDGYTADRPADPTETGYLFEGWYTDAGCTNAYDFNRAVMTDITLYAKWNKCLTVSFNMMGYGESVSSQNVLSGNTAERPADPVDEGAVFGGWYTDEACTQAYDFTTPVTTDLIIYAKWTELFTVSFDMRGHGEQIPSEKVLSGNTVSEPDAPSEEGYRFTGWYADEGLGEAFSFDTPITADTTIYAGWTGTGSGKPLDPIPYINEDTTEIHLVQGQKFTLPEGNWTLSGKEDKKLLTLTKKGVLKAKKEGIAVLNRQKDGKTVQSISVNISKPVIDKKMEIRTGEKPEQIKLTFDKQNLEVYWYSSAPDVATVDQEGTVTAAGRGKTIVTAFINGRAYKCTVTVKEPQPAKERTLHMNVGATKSLSIKGVKSPVWSSASDNIASFKKNRLTANAAGETILTAVTKDGTEYKVKLIVEDICLKTAADGEEYSALTKAKGKNKYNITLRRGESFDLEFISLQQAICFKNTKPEIAFTDTDGCLTARKAGKTKLTAKLNGKTVTVNVEVKD